jgi:predicted phage tail protein
VTNDEQKKLAEAVSAAITHSVREMLQDEEVMRAFWEASFTQLQRRATAGAGGWLLGSFGAILSKISMFAAVALLVYALGGWAALVKVVAIMDTSK